MAAFIYLQVHNLRRFRDVPSLFTQCANLFLIARIVIAVIREIDTCSEMPYGHILKLFSHRRQPYLFRSRAICDKVRSHG